MTMNIRVPDRPRIAVVVCGDPSKNNGGSSRALNTILALRKLGTVDLYLVTSDRLPVGELAWMADTVHSVVAQGRRVLPQDYVLMLLGIRPRRLLAAGTRGKRREVEQIMRGKFDLIWTYADQAFLCLPDVYVRASTVVADLLDFEVDRDIQLARLSPSHRTVRTLLARFDGRALRRTLHRIVSTADRAVISSDVDRRRLGSPQVSVLPNAYDLKGPPVGRTDHVGAPVYLFVGLLGYGPNRDAVNWLVEEVWPEVLKERPDAQLRIVGRGLSEQPEYDLPGVTMVGEVPFMEPELSEASASLAPIRIGSGSRIKILEAWAHGVPVISTSIGAEGLRAEHEHNLLIGDTPLAFAECMLRVGSDQELSDRLATNGRETWSMFYDRAAFSNAVATVANSAMSNAWST